MEEQFVTYEIASKLKELGFGMDDYLQLPFYYDKEGNLHLMEVCVSKKYNPSPNHLGADTINDFDAKINWVDNSLDEVYLAPLWQQAINWFDKEKSIAIMHYYNINCNKWQYIIVNKRDNSLSDNYYSKEQVILKAIELCKNN